MTLDEFKCSVFKLAEQHGYTMEINRKGLQQINFGHKKLHEAHLEKLFPKVLEPGAHIPTLINIVAPGRPCTHRPMSKIIEQISTRSL